MKLKWYTGFFDGTHHYTIGSVRYEVESRFQPFPKPEQQTIRDRVEKTALQ